MSAISGGALKVPVTKAIATDDIPLFFFFFFVKMGLSSNGSLMEKFRLTAQAAKTVLPKTIFLVMKYEVGTK